MQFDDIQIIFYKFEGLGTIQRFLPFLAMKNSGDAVS